MARAHLKTYLKRKKHSFFSQGALIDYKHNFIIYWNWRNDEWFECLFVFSFAVAVAAVLLCTASEVCVCDLCVLLLLLPFAWYFFFFTFLEYIFDPTKGNYYFVLLIFVFVRVLCDFFLHWDVAHYSYWIRFHLNLHVDV